LKFDIDIATLIKTIVDRQDALEARVQTLEAKLDMLMCSRKHELSEEQREILLAENMTVREKAEKLGKSKSWVAKWMGRS